MPDSEWVDFRSIRSQVRIEDVLVHRYGLSLVRRGNKLIGPCPIHKGDSPRAFHADTEQDIYYCFTGCKAGGNVIDLMCAMEGLSVRDAALELKRQFLTDETSPRTRTAIEPDRDGAPNPPIDVRLQLRADYPYLAERGISLETATHFGVGYCSRGTMRGTIAIPIHNGDGELIAYAGRRLKPQDVRDEGKYAFPKRFKKRFELYNLHRAREDIANHGAVLVEGFFDVLWLHQAGFAEAVACMGSALSERQADLLTVASNVVVLFDGDKAGDQGAVSATELLRARELTVHHLRLADGAQPTDLSPRALRWLINGARMLDLPVISLRS